MNFDLNEDQQEIKRTARDLLTSRSTFEKVRKAAEAKAYDDALWKELVELGWPGIAISEEHGGQGLGTVELAILCEELGCAVAPSPFLSTVTAAAVIQAGGSDEQRARWLPALASREAAGAPGAADGLKQRARWMPRLASGEPRRGLGAADGLVPDADAPAVIVLLGEDGVPRLLAREDADVTAVESIDPTRRTARVSAPPTHGEALGDAAAEGVDRATVAVAAELVGVSQ